MKKFGLLLCIILLLSTVLSGCGGGTDKNGVPSSYNGAYTDETNYLVIENDEIIMNETKCEVTWIQTDLFSDREIPVVHFTYEGNEHSLYRDEEGMWCSVGSDSGWSMYRTIEATNMANSSKSGSNDETSEKKDKITTSEQVIYGDVFPDIVYEMGFISCEEDAANMTPTANDYYIEFESNSSAQDVSQRCYLYVFNEDGDVVSFLVRRYSKWQNEEPEIEYTSDDNQQYKSKYDVAFYNIHRGEYGEDVGSYVGYLSKGLSTKQIHVFNEYTGNTLLDSNYATPTTEDFIVDQSITNFHVRYFDGEMISDTQIQRWSDDEYSEYLDKELINENEDYILSSTYSFDSNENLVDIGVIYIFNSEKKAKYYQDCCWDFEQKECCGYTSYSRKGNILTLIDEELMAGIWTNHAEDGSLYYKWDFSPDDGTYVSKPDIPNEYRNNLNRDLAHVEGIYVEGIE